MVEWIAYILLLLLSVAGLLISILGLPGLWLMVGSFACYAWLTGWDHYIGWASMGTVIGLGLVAELAEFLAGAAGSKAAGGRLRGMFGAIVGAIVGGIAFSFIPVPVVSTIAGACIGAFVGAAILELTDRDFVHAMKVGWGAAKGRFWGIVVKLSIGTLMLIIVAIAAFA